MGRRRTLRGQGAWREKAAGGERRLRRRREGSGRVERAAGNRYVEMEGKRGEPSGSRRSAQGLYGDLTRLPIPVSPSGSLTNLSKAARLRRQVSRSSQKPDDTLWAPASRK